MILKCVGSDVPMPSFRSLFFSKRDTSGIADLLKSRIPPSLELSYPQGSDPELCPPDAGDENSLYANSHTWPNHH